VLIELRSKFGYDCPKSCVMNRIFTEMVKDSLNEYSYYAELAGLEYSLSNSTDGISISIYGFNDKLHVLLTKIIHKLKYHIFTIEEFVRVKEQVFFLVIMY
jgi:insulysin